MTLGAAVQTCTCWQGALFCSVADSDPPQAKVRKSLCEHACLACDKNVLQCLSYQCGGV